MTYIHSIEKFDRHLRPPVLATLLKNKYQDVKIVG